MSYINFEGIGRERKNCYNNNGDRGLWDFLKFLIIFEYFSLFFIFFDFFAIDFPFFWKRARAKLARFVRSRQLGVRSNKS
jgi:hypothetical protein